jgi:hypothetical protein
MTIDKHHTKNENGLRQRSATDEENETLETN